MEKKIIKTDTYRFERIIYEDNTTVLRRECDGFNVYELMGILDLIQNEIRSLFSGEEIHFDKIERKVIVDNNSTTP